MNYFDRRFFVFGVALEAFCVLGPLAPAEDAGVEVEAFLFFVPFSAGGVPRLRVVADAAGVALARVDRDVFALDFVEVTTFTMGFFAGVDAFTSSFFSG